MKHRQERLESILRKILTEFFLKHSQELTGVSINRIELSEKINSATAFIKIHPTTAEKEVLEKIKRNKKKIWEYAASKIKIKYFPRLIFAIDKGEENRRKIEELLKN